MLGLVAAPTEGVNIAKSVRSSSAPRHSVVRVKDHNVAVSEAVLTAVTISGEDGLSRVCPIADVLSVAHLCGCGYG